MYIEFPSTNAYILKNDFIKIFIKIILIPVKIADKYFHRLVNSIRHLFQMSSTRFAA